MTYAIGQKVCLWQVEHTPGSANLTVAKEVIVTVTEIKNGVPGEFTREPVSLQSLRGVGDDGKTYEKHWETWPESQTNDFIDQWSIRDDGEGDQKFWIPKEAVYVYDMASRRNRPSALTLVDPSGTTIKPKGDVVYCEVHDSYSHQNSECLFCLMDKRRQAD